MEEVRPERGELSERKGAQRPESFDKLCLEPKENPPYSRDNHISSLDCAHSAFQNAPREAKLAFLACYADVTDPVLKRTLELMVGQELPSNLLLS